MRNIDIVGAEVYAVLSKVSKEQYNKIPSNIISVFEKFKDNENKIELRSNIEFEQQNISKEAKDIIFAISLNYWLTEEERKEVLVKLKENEAILNKKFNVENIIKEVSEKEIKEHDGNIIIVKEERKKWYIRVINKIRNILLNCNN